MTNYTGYKVLTDDEMATFYENGNYLAGIHRNQYIIAGDDVYKCNGDSFVRVGYNTIHNDFIGDIRPMDDQQRMAMDMLADRNTTVKLIKGVYGSGKDFLMMNAALELLDKGEFEKIYFVRPNVTVKDVPDIGFLPNGVEDKLAWTLGPVIDKVGGDLGLERLMKQDKFEMVPLLFIRGRSFENAIIYVTEAQNITSEIAKLLIGRIGEGSELWLNGDTHQSDNKVYDRDNGLTKMIDRLKGHELFSYVYLPITHRSKTAELASLLDDPEDI